MIERSKQLPISGCQTQNSDMVPTAGAVSTVGTVYEVIPFAFLAMQIGIIPMPVFGFIVAITITNHVSSHHASALRIRGAAIQRDTDMQ